MTRTEQTEKIGPDWTRPDQTKLDGTRQDLTEPEQNRTRTGRNGPD